MNTVLAISWIALVGFSSLAFSREEKPVILHLASGAEVSGVILSDGFDEASGIQLRRDDNGGMLRLRWDQILPADVEAIKRSYGFISDEPPPILVRALKVRVGTNEMVGLDGGMKNGQRIIIRRGAEIPVPAGALLENVMIDALEVENAPEAFERMRREQPPTKAVDWYNLGLVAESLTLYDQAKNCFDEALKADAQFTKKDVIEQRKKVLDLKAKETDAADQLRRIRALRMQRDFDTALKLATEFKTKWPSSSLLADVQSETLKLGTLQKADLINQLQSEIFVIARELCDKKALDKEAQLGPSMSWAEDSLFGDCLAALAKRKGFTDVNEVFKLWEQRYKYASLTACSYGAGTFILGTDAYKGLVKDEKSGKGGKDDDESAGSKKDGKKPLTLEEKIQQKIKERSEQAKKRDEKQKVVGELADVPPTPDEWWAAASTKERSSFLFAFFGEHARYEGKRDVLELGRVTARECSACAGKGLISFYATSSAQSSNGTGEFSVPCERCKKLTFDRIVHFR